MTLQDFLSDEEVKDYATSILFVSPTTTLGEAEDRMDNTPRCRDAFVTETGLAEEPVLGWVTNLDVARRLRA